MGLFARFLSPVPGPYPHRCPSAVGFLFIPAGHGVDRSDLGRRGEGPFTRPPFVSIITGMDVGKLLAAAVTIFSLVGALAANADPMSAGGLSFSDELGGFRILSVTGSGSTEDLLSLWRK
jgi:hypothetical protein